MPYLWSLLCQLLALVRKAATHICVSIKLNLEMRPNSWVSSISWRQRSGWSEELAAKLFPRSLAKPCDKVSNMQSMEAVRWTPLSSSLRFLSSAALCCASSTWIATRTVTQLRLEGPEWGQQAFVWKNAAPKTQWARSQGWSVRREVADLSIVLLQDAVKLFLLSFSLSLLLPLLLQQRSLLRFQLGCNLFAAHFSGDQ